MKGGIISKGRKEEERRNRGRQKGGWEKREGLGGGQGVEGGGEGERLLLLGNNLLQRLQYHCYNFLHHLLKAIWTALHKLIRVRIQHSPCQAYHPFPIVYSVIKKTTDLLCYRPGLRVLSLRIYLFFCLCIYMPDHHKHCIMQLV